MKLVVCNEAETWTLSKANVNRLKIFERKVVRKIYNAVNAVRGYGTMK